MKGETEMETNKNITNQCEKCFHKVICSLRTDYIREQERINGIEFVKPVHLECVYFAPKEEVK